MDDKKIYAFLTIARLGSLRKAAQALSYTQSGLSQMMNHLEQELGCRLLQRSYAGAALTAEGERLLPLFQAAEQALTQLQSRAGDLSGTQRRTIVIGTLPSLAKRWLPQCIRGFRALYPDVTLDLRLAGDEVIEWVAQGRVDLALVDDLMRRSYAWIPLCSDPMLAVFPAAAAPPEGEPVTPEQLGQYPFIMPTSRDMQAHILPWGRSLLRQAVSVAADDDSTPLSLVRQGLGVTILPALSLAEDSRGTAARALSPPLQRTLGIVLPPQAAPLIRHFSRFLQEHSTEMK